MKKGTEPFCRFSGGCPLTKGVKKALSLFVTLGVSAAAGSARCEAPDASVLGQLTLDRAAQVRFGLHHWSGPRDGSLALVLRRGGDRLLIEGTLRDDHAFLQPRATKLNPAWWKIEYGADGLRFILRSGGDSDEVRSDFYLDFGSQALQPRVVVASCEAGHTGPLPGTRLKFRRAPGKTHFLLSLPLDKLLHAPATLAGAQLEVRLYDLDSEMEDYTLLSDKVALEEKHSEAGSQESE